MSPERVDSGHVIFKYAEVLPDIERLLRVDGVLELELFASDVFAEVYCGCASVTLAATVHGVPAVFPWVIELGSHYNVCSGGGDFSGCPLPSDWRMSTLPHPAGPVHGHVSHSCARGSKFLDACAPSRRS